MPRHRLVALALLAAAAFQGVACGSKAVGVDDCREIEVARCEGAHSCDFGVEGSKEEGVCERFARDNCLHGLPGETAPTASQLNRCVKAIREASACAESQTGSLPALSCAPIASVLTTASATVCDIIENPDETTECSFLLPEPKPAVIVDAGSD